MSLIVQKFGGTSVRDAERVMNVAKIVTDTFAKGNDVVVVVSAQGDTTDDLLAKAEEINPKASRREKDMLRLGHETEDSFYIKKTPNITEDIGRCKQRISCNRISFRLIS